MSLLASIPVRDCLIFIARGATAAADLTETRIDDVLAAMIADAAHGTETIRLIEEMLAVDGPGVALPQVHPDTAQAVRLEISAGDVFQRLPEILALVKMIREVLAAMRQKPAGG